MPAQVAARLHEPRRSPGCRDRPNQPHSCLGLYLRRRPIQSLSSRRFARSVRLDQRAVVGTPKRAFASAGSPTTGRFRPARDEIAALAADGPGQSVGREFPNAVQTINTGPPPLSRPVAGSHSRRRYHTHGQSSPYSPQVSTFIVGCIRHLVDVCFRGCSSFEQLSSIPCRIGGGCQPGGRDLGR